MGTESLVAIPEAHGTGDSLDAVAVRGNAISMASDSTQHLAAWQPLGPGVRDRIWLPSDALFFS